MDLRNIFGDWMDFLDESMLLKYRSMVLQCVSNNIPIEPSSEKVFRCFKVTPAKELKAVILGQD